MSLPCNSCEHMLLVPLARCPAHLSFTHAKVQHLTLVDTHHSRRPYAVHMAGKKKSHKLTFFFQLFGYRSVGMELENQDGKWVVAAMRPGGPADRSGLIKVKPSLPHVHKHVYDCSPRCCHCSYVHYRDHVFMYICMCMCISWPSGSNESEDTHNLDDDKSETPHSCPQTWCCMSTARDDVTHSEALLHVR